jgi:hypothetical protein
LCANEGSAATSDSQKIINSGWLFIVGGFAQEGQVVFRPGLFFFEILARRKQRAEAVRLNADCFSSLRFPAKLREWN